MEETKTVHREEKVKSSSAAWLGAANAATGLLCSFAEGSAVTYFFVTHLGLDAKFNAIAWILFGIWNAINDPIYGFIADRTKSKLGRRRPWIRYGAPIMALLYAIMWFSYPNMVDNQWFLFFQELLSLFLFDILYTAIASAIYVMPYEMAVTNKARNKIFLFNIGFSVISYGVPMIAGTYLNVLIEEQSAIFPWIMAGVGVLCGAVVFVSTFFYKENGYVKEEKQPRFWEGLKMCIKNKSFLLFEVISWTVIYAQSALMLGLTYMQGFWAIDPTILTKDGTAPIGLADSAAYASSYGWLGGSSMYVLYGAIFLGLIGGLLFFVFMRDRLGVRVNTLIMTGIMGAGTLIASFLGMYFWVMVLGFFCIGVGLAGGLYLVPMVNGDVMDKDEIDNGARREGVYAGINSLITKPAQSIAQAVFPIMLASFGFNSENKYVAQTGSETTNWFDQPNTAKNWFFFCWLLITAVLLILSFVAMWFYPLHGKKWAEQKEALALAHAEKEEAYEQAILAKIEAGESPEQAAQEEALEVQKEQEKEQKEE